MKRNFPTEFLYQVFALIISVILVHAVYVTLVRPQATAIIAEQTLRIQEDENYTPERSLYVLIRDFEQEACLVLMLWAFAIMGFKAVRAAGERKLLVQELVQVREGVRILPEDTREYARTLQALPDSVREMLLPSGAAVLAGAFRVDRERAGCVLGGEHAVRVGGRAPGIGAVHDPLYRLGDTLGGVHRAPFGASARRSARRTARWTAISRA